MPKLKADPLKAVPDELTTKDMQDLFDVSGMCLFNWRKGSKRRSKLPCSFRKRGTQKSVVFKKEVVIQWAAKNNVAMAHQK